MWNAYGYVPYKTGSKRTPRPTCAQCCRGLLQTVCHGQEGRLGDDQRMILEQVVHSELLPGHDGGPGKVACPPAQRTQHKCCVSLQLRVLSQPLW